MSGKIAAELPPLPSRSPTDWRDGEPALTELTPAQQALCSIGPDLLAGLTEALADCAAVGSTLVDLSDEQVVERAEDMLVDMLSTAFPGADPPKAVKSLAFERERVGVYVVRVHGIVAVRPFKDLPRLRSAAASHLKQIALEVEFVAGMRLASDGGAHGRLSVGSVHYDTIAALEAREAAIQGKAEPVASLASLVLGLHRSERWNEAVSTALLGSWTEPLLRDTGNSRSAMDRLQTEARTIHKQLTPIWRREVRGSRLLLLDTPMGKDATLYDLVASGLIWEDASPDWPDDARLGALLRALQPEERAVVLARACPGVASWKEAAYLAGATDPVAMGKRICRKVNRLRAHHEAHAAAAVRQQLVRAARDSARLAVGPEPGGRGE
ncbi:hypothetical protein OK006_3271 [Actinobacteria bacterium OK006]|nr:hypothetical protein OK006_3271 [Actinobacteria bacterium OK006]